MRKQILAVATAVVLALSLAGTAEAQTASPASHGTAPHASARAVHARSGFTSVIGTPRELSRVMNAVHPQEVRAHEVTGPHSVGPRFAVKFPGFVFVAFQVTAPRPGVSKTCVLTGIKIAPAPAWGVLIIFVKTTAKSCVFTVIAALAPPKAYKITLTYNDPLTATIDATVTSGPNPTDIVGVGSDTTGPLFDQFGVDYDSTVASSAPHLYSFDAVNPANGMIDDMITTKEGCAQISRPDGSGQGISALEANTMVGSDYCIDFARSSRARESTDPACATGGICFVALAGDAVTWSDRTTAAGGTDAPATLTPAQLTAIYECTDTNWDQVGGKDAPIEAFLPQTSSGTRTFWLTALGGGVTPITPGSCVSDLPTSSDPNGTLEENEGINPALNSPETIFIYSVGAWLGQVYHSAACLNSTCTANADGQVCTPATGQNAFSCNESGVLGLGKISGVAPTTSAKVPTINTKFPVLFQRSLYDVVRYDASTTDHIPAYEEPIFSAATASTPGWACTSKTAQAAIVDYGFLAKWPLSTCGAVN
jgi:ABC-type phosphate transport system substrate-binding protein